MSIFDKFFKRKAAKENSQVEAIDGFVFCEGYYEATIDGINIGFDIGKQNSLNAQFAKKVVAAYVDILPNIHQLLLADEGFSIFFPETFEDDLVDGLGKPTIRVMDSSSGIISYCDHSFDDVHIIDIEFSGILEDLFYVSIDG